MVGIMVGIMGIMGMMGIMCIYEYTLITNVFPLPISYFPYLFTLMNYTIFYKLLSHYF